MRALKAREQCRSTVLEYEESMQVWEEMKDTPATPTRKRRMS